jgi:hypothetical protein
MEVYKVSEAIESKIKLLEKMRVEIRDRALQKAESAALYDKAMAITIIRLKNGEEMELDGQYIKNPIGTIIDKIARGICWKEKLECDKAEALYKSLISNIDSVMAEMNAYQSINRYLDKG